MINSYPQPPAWVKKALLQGQVIPAHPLALTPEGKLDERYQRGLTRYYHAAGAGGLAVAVHTTQFEIRECGMFEPVLALAAEEMDARDEAPGNKMVRIAGVIGKTAQALEEARHAADLGYHAALLSLAAWREADQETLLAHCHAVAEVIPLVGFYLQPAVGGRILPYAFWRQFAEIPNVIAIKIAPFNRYQTLEVIHAVAASGRAEEIALYTGNDDNILLDLLTPFAVTNEGRTQTLRFAGGLLGHWACWTHAAVDHLALAHRYRDEDHLPTELLTLAAQITDANAVLFDAANDFAGCIPGIHAVLHRQGLLRSLRCLNPNEVLSAGQQDEIERIYRVYPHLHDDDFVAENLDTWLN